MWVKTTEQLPPNGVEVDTKIDDINGARNKQKLTRQNNLWFSEGMYVYYTPTHWRSA